jgi:hypothetical protein
MWEMLEWLKVIPWTSWLGFVPVVPALVFGQSYVSRDGDARQFAEATEKLQVEVTALRQQNTHLEAVRQQTEQRQRVLEQQITRLQASLDRPGGAAGASDRPAATPVFRGSVDTSAADRARDEDRERRDAEESRARQEREQKDRARQACENGKKSCFASCAGLPSSVKRSGTLFDNYDHPRDKCENSCRSISCPGGW